MTNELPLRAEFLFGMLRELLELKKGKPKLKI
jgi:hypothetical protein